MIEAAEATRNPYALSNALWSVGFALRDIDPDRALHALRRGMVIAQDSGNRANESYLSIALSSLESAYGDPLAALDYAVMAIRNYHDSGGPIQVPLAVLAAIFDRLGRYESAAVIAGFALSPLNTTGLPEFGTAIAHLRDVLGHKTCESLAQEGQTMTAAAMAASAYDEIDQGRQRLRP